MEFLISSAKPKTTGFVEPSQSTQYDLDQLEKRVNLTDQTLVSSQTPSTTQSSSSKKSVASPCEIFQPFASFNHNLIHTKCQDYEQDVKTPILLALSNLPEVAFSYKDSFQSFSCKLSHGSSYRYYEIDCFWDPKNNEHVVDVRSVGGEGFYKFACDLTVEVTKVFDASFNPPESAVSSWMQVRPVPASLINEVESEIARQGGPSPIDSFSQGIDNIVALSKHDFMDTRVQALQMLCDLSGCSETSQNTMLCDPNVVRKVVSTVQEGLNDQFQEVREFAVIAAEILATSFTIYQTALGQSSPVVATLLAQLQSYPDAEAYLHLHTVRAAARALVKLSAVATEAIRQEVAVLLNCHNVNEWQQFVASLRDEQAKNAASQLSQVFEEQAFPVPFSSPSTAIEITKEKLSRTHFYLQDATLSGAIQKLLAGFQFLSPYQVATSLSAKENQFFSKVVSRSEVSVFVTSVYFDADKGDHVAEVRRVSGDGSFMRRRDFFEALRLATLTSVIEPNEEPVEDEDEEEDLLVGSMQLTREQYYSSISHIVTFARDPYAESRIEGVKMLIDSLQTRHYATYLQDMECVRLIVTALNALLYDTVAEVQELTLLAIAAFASWHVNFAKEFATQTGILLEIVRDTPVTELCCYKNTLKIRAAVSALKEIALVLPEITRESIQNTLNIETRENWAEFMGALVSNDRNLDSDLSTIESAVF